MNATSFQVPASFVWSSPKHGEPWSRSPVVDAAQIMILLLAGMVPLPRLAAISAVCYGFPLRWYRAIRRMLRIPTQMVPSYPPYVTDSHSDGTELFQMYV